MSLNEPELLERISALEARIAKLENRSDAEDEGDFIFIEEATPPYTPPLPSRAIRPRGDSIAATQVLGWGGVLALVMAAAYLIKLGIDLGWLTPARQVLLAFTGGSVLVGAGLFLRRADREYASLLPAGGIAILFLSVYGAHLYYRLVEFPVAVSAVILICALALWLCHHFSSELYAYIAIAGSYTAPLLLHGLRANVADLAIYYTAWSLLFSVYAIWLQQRRIYLVAAYFALLGFDLLWFQQWHAAANPQWVAALTFQAVQFIVFAAATTIYTIQHDDKLDQSTALSHLPPLLLFYALEYNLLDRYLHAYAPWVAILSLLVLLAFYAVARIGFRFSLEGGQLILSCYAALVLFHAVYLELLPDHFAPWAGLGVGLILAAWLTIQKGSGRENWPLLGALGLIFAINGLRALLHYDLGDVAGHNYLTLAYAAEIYAAYFCIRKHNGSNQFKGMLLYAGHLSAMAAPVHIFDERLPVSFCWALLAVVALILALKLGDKLMAKSSLFIFAISGAKVLIYDLDRADPLIRIGCLVILGISFYTGGWLYRKVNDIDT